MARAKINRLLIVLTPLALVHTPIGSAKAGGSSFTFTTGDLVVSVEGNGVEGATSGPYTDNQAAPLTLFEFDPNGTSNPATYEGSLVLPQTASGANFPVSGEYGSSSEGTLQLSGNGKYLTIAGYGVNASSFNANPAMYSSTGNPALGQSGSLTGQSYTAVPRVVAEIGANGLVNSTTALYNVFDQNNPRSVYSVDGTSFYVSGQGNFPDATGGVFYATLGSHSATSITGPDAGSGDSQDTRTVKSMTASSTSRPTARRGRPIGLSSARSGRRDHCRQARRTAAMVPRCCPGSATLAEPAKRQSPPGRTATATV